MDKVNQRFALETLWKDKADVFVLKSVKNQDTKIEEFKEVKIFENLKCKLGYKTASSTKESGTMRTDQQIILVMGNEICIHEGSKIVVTTQDGKKEVYYNSGFASVATSHQQIQLTRKKRV